MWLCEGIHSVSTEDQQVVITLQPHNESSHKIVMLVWVLHCLLKVYDLAYKSVGVVTVHNCDKCSSSYGFLKVVYHLPDLGNSPE